MIKLIASDMDGTILKNHSELHEENIKAVRYIEEKGIPFVICTGRDWDQAQMCLTKADIQCPVVALNGAAVYDAKGELLYSACLQVSDVLKVIEEATRKNCYVEVMTAQGSFTNDIERRKQEVRLALLKDYPNVSDEQAEFEVNKFMTTFPVIEVDDWQTLLNHTPLDLFKMSVTHTHGLDRLVHMRHFIDEQLNDIVVTSSYFNNIEINHINAQKGLALEKIAQELGVSMDHVFAIGDNDNDLSMLERAGYSVAMGNGTERVKATAKYQTTTFDQGGVAKAIFELVR